MDLDALLDCVTTSSCVVTQTTSGLIVGMLLFLVAAGLTLIFGVLKIVNFAHGTFYMLGAYLAYTVFQITGSYILGVLGGGSAWRCSACCSSGPDPPGCTAQTC